MPSALSGLALPGVVEHALACPAETGVTSNLKHAPPAERILVLLRADCATAATSDTSFAASALWAWTIRTANIMKSEISSVRTETVSQTGGFGYNKVLAGVGLLE